MSDITASIFPSGTDNHQDRSEFTRDSVKIYIEVKNLHRQILEDLKQLKSSALPIMTNQDNEYLAALAKINKEAESLKSTVSSFASDTARCHANAVIACLYSMMKEISTSVKEIQKVKERQQRVYEGIENTRKLKEEVNVKTVNKHGPEFRQESKQLLIELQTNNEDMLNTQKSLAEISNIMDFFSQKVFEQEQISQRIQEEASDALMYMENAKEQLKSASRHSKGFEYLWVAYFVTLTLFLLFYEWWNTQYIYVN